MTDNYFEDKTFDSVDYSVQPLPKGEYENCSFINCVFTNADLSNIKFTECKFNSCNCSMANIAGTSIRDIQFKDCKLVGLHFEKCNSFLFAASYDNCNLTLASFYKLKLKKSIFRNCTLQEVDFSETDLTEALFANCDLSGAIFKDSILEKADLRSSFNYSIDPEKNRIKKAKFSIHGIAGLLDKYNIVVEN